MIAEELQLAVRAYYKQHTPIEKSRAVDELTSQLSFVKKGKLYIAMDEQYAVRFSYSTKDSFANTVLALKNVLKYDHIPVILCLLKPLSYEFMLVNTTFLKKISHSSKALTETNIRGSFLGHDIMREIELAPDRLFLNTPEHFSELFAFHQGIDTDENITRLVEETSQISSQRSAYIIDAATQARIHQSLLYSFTKEEELQRVKRELDQLVAQHHEQILRIATEEAANVNLRGNRIEQLLTKEGLNQHGLADEIRLLEDGGRLLIDIKTSIGSATANAKLYNIDKQLEALSDGRTVCAVYLLHMNTEKQRIETYMLNSFDEDLLDQMLVQHHWSGRNARGSSQLHARVFQALSAGNRQPRLNKERALAFIDGLIAMGNDKN
ncbi:hypothetical protein ACFP56_11170 [Paenibacillus septentrionalis]|uniref:Uncharacterized protein n=1 Tax=Paenibacillus septentrionalis TaxID=429342 RepID=A0ABW1V702_9BACL